METFYYINSPVVNIRERPTNGSRVVSQALFSERIQIEKEEGSWFSIRTSDEYPGWIEQKYVTLLDHTYDANLKTSRLATHIFGIKDTEYGPLMTLPYGSKLKALDVSDPRWLKVLLPNGQECFVQKGDVAPEPILSGKKELVPFSQKFLGLPYTWGGRSSFGYDCSGFIQMLYGKVGIFLPRDSNQQVADIRFRVITIDELEPGDLVFFGKSSERITHVGMALSGEQFIHSTTRENAPWIRISALLDFEWNGSKGTACPYRTFRQFIL